MEGRDSDSCRNKGGNYTKKIEGGLWKQKLI